MVRPLGTYVEIGFTGGGAAGSFEMEKVNFSALVFSRNVHITSVRANTPACFDRAFRLLQRDGEPGLPFSRLITHEFHSFEELDATMHKMGDPDYLKPSLTRVMLCKDDRPVLHPYCGYWKISNDKPYILTEVYLTA